MIEDMFRERFKQLVERDNLSQYRVAELLDVTLPTVNGYLVGRTTPHMWNLAKICEVFGCSADWLIGANEQSKDVGTWNEINDTFFERKYSRCSRCGDTWDVRSRYCPSCGAKMTNGNYEGYDIEKLWDDATCRRCKWFALGACKSPVRCGESGRDYDQFKEVKNETN